MITGEITVSGCCGNAVVPVELLDRGPRSRTVWVRALNGLAPFTRFSHGGPFQDTTAIWQASNVLNIRVEEGDEQPAETDPEETPETETDEVREDPAEDWFLEMAYEDRTWIE